MDALYDIPEPALVERRKKEYARDFIRPYLPADRSAGVLDLGCGHGLFLHTCALHGYTNLTGVEQEPTIAQYARDQFRLSGIITGDLKKFIRGQPPASYEVIVAFNIIEHLPRAEVMETFTGIHILLAPGGLFIAEVPNGDSPLGLHTLYSDITHQGAFTELLMKQLLRRAGFSQVSVYPRFVNKNPVLRLGQKLLAKVVGLDSKLMFSGNIVAAAVKSD